MAEPLLRAGFWVKAQIKICYLNAIPVVVTKKGDPDAGAVFIKIDRLDKGVTVLSQTRDDQGHRVWITATGPDPVTSQQADAYLERQNKYDPDLWILEIEDRDGRYHPGEDIV